MPMSTRGHCLFLVLPVNLLRNWCFSHLLKLLSATKRVSVWNMDRSSPLDVTIIDKDESSDQAYHVVDGFIIEDSKSPFPVS